MQLHFHKYQGTGNDFILLDNRERIIDLSREQVALMCHRRFGIGADGLMLLEDTPDADFRMVYFNADGGQSTMCGNGGRCMAAFARSLGIIDTEATFLAVDGLHQANIDMHGIVELHMSPVSSIRHQEAFSLLDTGSPHHIKWVDDIDGTDVFSEGRAIRQSPEYAPGGVNVNFVRRLSADALHVRTYERGVEDETLSCGTGVTAAAIAASGISTGTFVTKVSTPGGDLSVAFTKDSADSAVDVILKGPATFVYSGTYDLRH